MRDPSPDKEERLKRAKRAKKEKRNKRAIKYARTRLIPLRVVSLNKANADKPAEELQAAIAVLQTIADDDSSLTRLTRDAIRAILPIFKRARPAVGPHGRHTSAYAFRNQLIRETVTSVCHQHGFHPTRSPTSLDRTECGCSIVSKALQEIGITLTEKRIQGIWENSSIPD